MSSRTPVCSICAITGSSGISMFSTSLSAGGLTCPSVDFGRLDRLFGRRPRPARRSGGVSGGIGRGVVDLDLIHRDLVLARADQVADFGHATLSCANASFFKPEVAVDRVAQPFGDHRVERDRRNVDAIALQHTRS